MEDLFDNLFNKSYEDDRKVLCNVCNRYLSVPPIYYNQLLGNICGRCKEENEVIEAKKTSILERQKVFEYVAKYLTFPCSFKNNGCGELLEWGEVDTHESSCMFMNTVCFLSDGEFLEDEQERCQWNGDSLSLASHFYNEHSTNVFKSIGNLRIILGLESASILGPLFGTDEITCEPKFRSKIYCIETFNSIMIVLLYYHPENYKYTCQIFTNLSYSQSKLIEYQVEIFDDNRKHSIRFPKACIETLRNNFPRKGTCVDAIEIDLYYIKKLLRKPHFLTADFKIFKQKSLSSDLDILMKNLTPYGQCEDMEKMRCNFCSFYLSPPIYCCTNGHNICRSCKGFTEDEQQKNSKACRVCGAGWCSYRNTAMERLTYLINYPCINRNSGCLYVAPMPIISRHETMCCRMTVESKTCYFKTCPWRGSRFYKSKHLKQEHCLLKTNEIYRLEDQKCYLYFDNNIFVLEMDFSVNNHLRYTIMCCESSELKYRYELKLFDADVDEKFNSSLILSQLCEPQYIADSEYSGVTIPFTVLPQVFLNYTKVLFKINIYALKHL